MKPCSPFHRSFHTSFHTSGLSTHVALQQFILRAENLNVVPHCHTSSAHPFGDVWKQVWNRFSADFRASQAFFHSFYSTLERKKKVREESLSQGIRARGWMCGKRKDVQCRIQTCSTSQSSLRPQGIQFTTPQRTTGRTISETRCSVIRLSPGGSSHVRAPAGQRTVRSGVIVSPSSSVMKSRMITSSFGLVVSSIGPATDHTNRSRMPGTIFPLPSDYAVLAGGCS